MNFIMNHVREMLTDKNKASFGRIIAVPFLVGSWGLSMASGIMAIIHHSAVVDDAAALAITGFALYYGSKHLSLKGDKINGESSDTPA